jgi:hypothetical protein
MICLESEHLIAVADAPSVIPGRPHKGTVWRWVLNGIRGIKLESIVVGSKRFTSREAVDRFISATTAVANGEPAPTRSPRAREREIARATDELDRMGV